MNKKLKKNNMKFGKKFVYYKIPEWAEHYLDYYSLKTILKFIDNRRSKKKGVKKLKQLKKRLSQDLIKKKTTKNYPISLSEVELLDNQHPLQRSLPNLKKKHISGIGPHIIVKTKLKKSKTEKQNIDSSINSETTTIYVKEKDPLRKREILNQIEDLSELNDNQKKEHFKRFYESKVELVDKFFCWKLSDYEQYFLNTKQKMEKTKENGKKNKNIYNEESLSKNDDYNNPERDEFDYATSWKRALSSLYNFTSWLHSFHTFNNLAIKKIQKKTKKIFDAIYINNIDKELIEIDNKFQFFKLLPQIIELRKKVKKLFADKFCDGNIKEAEKELNIILRGERFIGNKIMIWFYYGGILFSFLFYLFLCFNQQQKKYELYVFLPAFNFSLIIIFVMFGISINLLVLQRFDINYLYIFQNETNLRIGFSNVYEISLMLFLFWFIMMIGHKIVLHYDAIGDNFVLFPIIEIISLFVFFVFPFRILYRHFRLGILLCYLKTFIPFGKKGVLFRDFIIGDCLTSLVIPFSSLVMSICMFANQDCRRNNIRIDKCNRDTVGCFILILYPFVIRLIQIINRLIYSGNYCLHIINIFKYLTSICFYIFLWIHKHYNKDETIKVLEITFGILQSLYQYLWDVYIDWGLGNFNSINCILRDKLVYPKNFYFFSIILNFIFRFNWTLLLISCSPTYQEFKILGFSSSEVIRRVIWCIIRIENEAINNPEDYREILVIPGLHDS